MNLISTSSDLEKVIKGCLSSWAGRARISGS